MSNKHTSEVDLLKIQVQQSVTKIIFLTFVNLFTPEVSLLNIQAQQSVTKIISISIMNLATSKAGAKRKLLFNKSASEAGAKHELLFIKPASEALTKRVTFSNALFLHLKNNLFWNASLYLNVAQITSNAKQLKIFISS